MLKLRKDINTDVRKLGLISGDDLSKFVQAYVRGIHHTNVFNLRNGITNGAIHIKSLRKRLVDLKDRLNTMPAASMDKLIQTKYRSDVAKLAHVKKKLREELGIYTALRDKLETYSFPEKYGDFKKLLLQNLDMAITSVNSDLNTARSERAKKVTREEYIQAEISAAEKYIHHWVALGIKNTLDLESTDDWYKGLLDFL